MEAMRSARAGWPQLVAFFIVGFGPFAVANALWVEEPYMKIALPERSDIGAYIGGFYNAGTIFLPIVFLVQRFVVAVPDIAIICVSLCLAIAAGLISALLGAHEGALLGLHGSVFVWLAAFLAGSAGSLLVLSLFSYAHRFPARCTTSLATGLSASGIVTALAGDAQRPGPAPDMRFSFELFMLVNGSLAAFLALCAILFIHWSSSRRRAVMHSPVPPTENALLLNEEPPIYTDADIESSSEEDIRPRSSAFLPDAKQLGVLRTVSHPVIFGFCSAFCAYIYNPGLVPFLSSDSVLLSRLVTAYMIGSTIGAILTGWIKLPRLDINVFIMAWLLLFLCLFGVSKSSDFNVPEVLMLPAVVFVSMFNGYNTTHNYILAENLASKAGLHGDDCQKARRYAALANQFGVLGGSYFLVLLVHFDAFVEKAPKA